MNRQGHSLHKKFKKNLLPSLRIFQGAGLATLLLSLSFFTLGESNTEDLRWMILPFIFVPAAGGLGGLFFHLMQPLREKGGIRKTLSNILSILVYLFLFALAFTLGMNGPN